MSAASFYTNFPKIQRGKCLAAQQDFVTTDPVMSCCSLKGFECKLMRKVQLLAHHMLVLLFVGVAVIPRGYSEAKPQAG